MKKEKKKDIIKLFIILGLYALSDGIFYNFQELWMMDNNLSVKTISTVFSLCAIITVSSIFIFSNIVKKEKTKSFATLLIFIKFLLSMTLYVLYGTGLNILIKFLIMMDYVIEVESYACFYPMMSFITKSDKVYSAKDLVYAGFYAIGVLLTSFLFGKNILGLYISYNTYCLITGFLLLAAFVLLLNINFDKYVKKTKDVDQTEVFTKLLLKIKNDKITKVYILYIMFGQIAYTTVLGMTMTFLTKGIGLESGTASLLYLIIGLAGVGFGILALAKLTPKCEYITLSIKYLLRTCGFVCAIIFHNKLAYIIAFLYPKFISSAYSHVTDGPFINRFDSKDQLAFCNLREMLLYLCIAFGQFLCGRAILIDIRINFAIAAIFCTLQWILSLQATYLRKQEVKENDRKQLG